MRTRLAIGEIRDNSERERMARSLWVSDYGAFMEKFSMLLPDPSSQELPLTGLTFAVKDMSVPATNLRSFSHFLISFHFCLYFVTTIIAMLLTSNYVSNHYSERNLIDSEMNYFSK